MRASILNGRILRGTIFIVLAVLVVVPPLVRASRRVSEASSSSTLRLNRGFDAPVAKSDVTPPQTAAPHWAVLHVPADPAPLHPRPSLDVPLPQPPPDPTPDSPRSPPAFPIA